MRDTVVFDIDGTLADITHRRHWVATKPKNWAAFEKGIPDDDVHWDVVELLRLHASNGYCIVLASGRGEQQRDATIQWLVDRAGLTEGKHFERLYMRKEKDYRADDIVKKEILEQMRQDGYWPVAAFDDRDRVVAMWRENGVRCYQVAPGNF